MATLPDVKTAVYNKLAGASALTALIGGSANPRIYHRQAPSGADRPYVLFDLASGLKPNQSPHDDINWVYRVGAWDDDSAQAEAVHNVIYSVLHQQKLSISGWTNYWTACDQVSYPPSEDVDGHHFFQVVGDYRVKASKD